jgi:hypothetical protein
VSANSVTLGRNSLLWKRSYYLYVGFKPNREPSNTIVIGQ